MDNLIKQNLLKTAKTLFGYFNLEGDSDLFLAELERDQDFLKAIEFKVANVPEFKTKHFSSIYQLGKAYKIIQYLIVRSIQPNFSVETGVLHGLSTSFLLKAIKENKKGQLVSIDKPASLDWKDRPVSESGKIDNDNLPLGFKPGWVIPDLLRCNWDLKLGLSSKLLPLIFKKKKCDYFVHDSEHTYTNMLFELNIAWKNLAPGGIIVCDNVDWSNAFSDFCSENCLKPILISEEGLLAQTNLRFGIVKK